MPRKIIDSAASPILREIPSVEMPSTESDSATGRSCPACGATLTWGPVPCPDGQKGCLVCHYGYCCSSCGKYWH